MAMSRSVAIEMVVMPLLGSRTCHQLLLVAMKVGLHALIISIS